MINFTIPEKFQRGNNARQIKSSSRNPLVSVIMPMYNSAKFIPQTLESLLYQTMKNFEVIVIDDCSTDNSVEVVESFSERFGGRLHIIKLPKNTGTPGIPRNAGIKTARGKYIAFLDSDDLYTQTALEEVTTLLENYQADVLYLNDTYMVSFNDSRINNFAALTNSANFFIPNWRYPFLTRPKPVDEPTFESDNLEERIKHCIEWKYRAAMCCNFCRRDFLLENNITFPDMIAYEDNIFNFACICLAKKLLLAPNIVYIIRARPGSITRDETSIKDAEKYFRKWLNVLNSEFNELEKFMMQISFFKTHIEYRYAVLEFFFRLLIERKFKNKYSQEYSPLIYQLLKKEFHPDNAALASYLFNLNNIQQSRMITTKKSPLVSVIMPMYNSAKFIPQTLESLLYQTMTDFEVIVIDDCSTDNSVEVVESFDELFGGRLHIIKLPKNTGGAGTPRNVGIQFARGKYISFLDSDDIYTRTALEELTTLAENYQADVVYLNDTYMFLPRDLTANDPRIFDLAALTNPANLVFNDWRTPILPRPKPLPAPVLESNNLEERVQRWVNWNYRIGVCANFSRREFLIENQITFPDMVVDEDVVFNFTCLCLAKNFVCAPVVYYIIRPISNSLSRDGRIDEKYFQKWLGVINDGFNEFEKVMDKMPALDDKSILRYSVLNFFFTVNYSRYILNVLNENYIPMFYQSIKKAFQGDSALLTTYLFDMVNSQLLNIIKLQTELQKLQGQGR